MGLLFEELTSCFSLIYVCVFIYVYICHTHSTCVYVLLVFCK